MNKSKSAYLKRLIKIDKALDSLDLKKKNDTNYKYQE